MSSARTGSRSAQPRLLQRWILVVALGVAAMTTLGFVVPAEHKWAPGAAAALLVFAGVVLTWRKSLAEDELRARAEQNERTAEVLADAARRRSAILFGYNLHEVLISIDGLAKRPPSERVAEIPAVRQSVAVQTKDGVSALSSRAAYFRVADLTATARVMSPDKVARSPDRHDGFTTVFDESDSTDSDVWKVVDGSIPTVLIDDVAAWAAARGDDRLRSYGTFITARVEAGGIPFGLLTVNAISPGSLVEDDVIFVEALARILGVVELLCLTTRSYQRAIDAASKRSRRMSAPPTRIDHRPGGTS